VMLMFRQTIISVGTLLLVAGSVSAEPTTKPAPAKPQAAATVQDTEFQATQAFNRGQYAIALPMLQKLTTAFKDQPDKLGPVQEMIRVSQKAIATANVQKNAVAVAPTPASNEARTPHPAPEAGKVQEMTIKELGNFDYDTEKGGNIPDDVKRLSGSQIRLRGYMIPIDQAERITKFALVPSLFECCFGQPPQIQHVVIVDCPPGKSVSYFPDELQIEGKLTVEEKKEDDVITSIYEVQTSSVKPAAK
jgi:hypothetical protein